MKLSFSAPSKTFLVGEYAVLAQAPALVLNTSPRFTLNALRTGETAVEGFHKESAAGRWLKAREPLLKGWSLEFIDPHERQGGFGASSSQFVLTHAFTTFLQSSFSRIVEGLGYEEVWKDYQALTNSQGSGADVLAQMCGQISLVDIGAASARAVSWPYPEIGFGIVRTHQKIATHEHLAQLDKTSMGLLVRPAYACVEAFGNSGSEVFLSRLKTFGEALKEFKLQAPAALTLIRHFEEQPWCLLAKGCGALGADTVLFMYPIEEREKVNVFLRKQYLTLVATQNDLTDGFEMKMTARGS